MPNTKTLNYKGYTAYIGGNKDSPEVFSYRKGFENPVSDRSRRFLAENKIKLQNLNKNIITLCDREADFFEFLFNLKEDTQFKFIIRRRWDHLTGHSYYQRKTRFQNFFIKHPVKFRLSN
jgi:hypothetical protein